MNYDKEVPVFVGLRFAKNEVLKPPNLELATWPGTSYSYAVLQTPTEAKRENGNRITACMSFFEGWKGLEVGFQIEMTRKIRKNQQS